MAVMAPVVVLLFLFVYTALYHNLVTRQYVVTSPKLDSVEPIRIVLLTDLHSYTYGSDQQPLIRRVKALDPDVICLVGDIADWVHPISGVELLLDGIMDIAPCLYVTGNHEYWSDIDAYRALFARYGLTVLDNEAVALDIKGQRIMFYGLDDPDYTRARDYGMFLNQMPPVDTDGFNVLLAHRPDPIEVYSGYGFDLVLSGHAHGGQVRIPFVLNGLFAPDEGWFPKYAGGLYDVNGTRMVVSRGLSYTRKLPRVFNPPEVVCVTLQGANSKDSLRNPLVAQYR